MIYYRVIVLIAVIALAAAPLVVYAEAQQATYIYTVAGDGSCDVSIMVNNTSGDNILYVTIDSNAIQNSIVALNSNGTPLPAELINQTTLEVVAGGAAQIYIHYQLNTTVSPGGIYDLDINPAGPATIVLPANAALLGFNGTPSVSYSNSKITLTYSSGGSYYVEFIIPPPPPATTTAATTRTLVSKTSTTQATATTPATITSTTTLAPVSSTSAATTVTSTAKTQSQATTSVKKTITTTKTTTATTTAPVKTQTATKTPAKRVSPALYAGIAVAVAAGAVGALIAARGRSGGGSSAPAAFEAKPPLELDERDHSILKALAEGEENISSLARKTGLSKSVVWRRIQKLARLGLVEREDRGGSTYIRLTSRGRREVGLE